MFVPSNGERDALSWGLTVQWGPQGDANQASLVVLVALLVAALTLVHRYNGLIRARERTREAWSGVEVQLRRRADLVPNLVATVRGYAAHERAVFDAVTRAHGAVLAARHSGELARAHQDLAGALGRLVALAETYPALRASEHFCALQQDLFDIEEKVAYARHFYNQNALSFNTRLGTVPDLLVARLGHFQRFPFFEAAAERPAPGVFFPSRPRLEPSLGPATDKAHGDER